MDSHRYPALFYGLYVLLGAAFALAPHWSYTIPSFLFLLYAKGWKQKLTSLLLLGSMFTYTLHIYSFPELGEEKVSGSGIFSVDSVSLQSSPFTRSYVYKGMLSSFETDAGKIWKRIPCRIYLPLRKGPLDHCGQLQVTGILIQKGPLNYVFKPSSTKPLSSASNFAHLRFELKEKFHAYLKTRIPDRRACTFLTSMLTGEIEERTLSLEFNRIGLQHILGVSGFQFVLLASFLGLLLRCIFPYRIAAILLLLLLTLYFIFLGNSPPVQRAWIAISVFLIGILANLRCPPLNALGVALILEILVDPCVITNIGFQLSFLCTFAILQLYPLMRIYLSRMLPTRSFEEIREMSLWDQHGYILGMCIRESLALNFAVHILSLPALLFLFHKFSLLSLIYNLFFPLGATLTFVLIILGLFFCLFLPPLGYLLCQFSSSLTAKLLYLTSYPPTVADYYIRVKDFPLEWVVFSLSLGILWIYQVENRFSEDVPQ